MLNIVETRTCGKVIGKGNGFGWHKLSHRAADMPIDGCRRWHIKGWLDAMHEVWAAERGRQSFRHDFQDTHYVLSFLILTRKRSLPSRGRRQRPGKHRVDDAR